MSDRVQAMKVFVTVVEAGSFSAASRRLHMGQPAVSKSVASLEERLGVQLLARSTRSQSLTEAGRRFYERASVALEEVEAAEAAARDEAAALTGRLRISAPPAYADKVILPRLPRFIEQHAGVTFEFALEDRRVDLLEEGVDLAIRAGNLYDSSMVARRIDRAQRMLVASPAYLERAGTPLHPDDLAGHDIVTYLAFDNREAWRFEREGTAKTVTLEPRIRLNAAEGVAAAALAGLGVAMVTDRMVGDALASGSLIPLLSDWHLLQMDVWVLFPQGRRVRHRARLFVDWLENDLRAHPPV